MVENNDIGNNRKPKEIENILANEQAFFIYFKKVRKKHFEY
jgi:hypothetical protein